MKRTIVGLVAAVIVMAAASPVRAEGGTIQVQADCTTVTVTTSGWGESSYGIVGITSNGPPYTLTPNGTTTYTVSDLGDGGYQWDVYISDVTEGHAAGFIACGEPALPVEDPAPDTTAPAHASSIREQPMPTAVGLDLTSWEDVAEAPPW